MDNRLAVVDKSDVVGTIMATMAITNNDDGFSFSGMNLVLTNTTTQAATTTEATPAHGAGLWGWCQRRKKTMNS